MRFSDAARRRGAGAGAGGGQGGGRGVTCAGRSPADFRFLDAQPLSFDAGRAAAKTSATAIAAAPTPAFLHPLRSCVSVVRRSSCPPQAPRLPPRTIQGVMQPCMCATLDPRRSLLMPASTQHLCHFSSVGSLSSHLLPGYAGARVAMSRIRRTTPAARSQASSSKPPHAALVLLAPRRC